MLMALPSCSTRTFWRFGNQTRLVLFLAWLTLLPIMGPLPHISQTLDILTLLFQKVFFINLFEEDVKDNFEGASSDADTVG